jgi:hypothetical protein
MSIVCWCNLPRPPADVTVLIVADRGFGDQKLYQVLTGEFKFDYLDLVPRRYRRDLSRG